MGEVWRGLNMEERDDIEQEEKKINWKELGDKLWNKKRFILIVTGIGVVLGVIIAFSIPKEYTTTIVLVPDVQSGNSSMGSLAAMAGINLSSSSGQDALASPQVYPNILSSTPFLKGLFDIKVKDAGKEIDTTLYSYLNDYQKSAWWSAILRAPGALKKLFSSEKQDGHLENTRILSSEELGIIALLRKKITVSSDKKTSVTTIEVTMQSPEISAFLADTLTSCFQSYIISSRTQKTRNDLEHTEKLYEDAKKNYYEAQQALASYVDGNLNVVSAKHRTNQERLQNEANLAYSVYNQTAQQVQMAKIKVQDNTPVFTIIQPAVQPLRPDLSKKKVVAVFLLLSIICAGAWVLRKDILQLF